jgi:hypothetical protein
MQTYKHRQNGKLCEAVQLSKDNVDDLELLTGGVSVVEHDALLPDRTYAALNVPTPEGNQRLQEGFWLVHVGNTFWVVRPGQFERMWEEVDESADLRTPSFDSRRG